MGWTKSEEKHLVSLHTQGLTLGQIAQTLDKSEDSVSSKLTRLQSKDVVGKRDRKAATETPAQAAMAAQVIRLRRENEKLLNQLGNWELLVQEFVQAAPTLWFPEPVVSKACTRQDHDEQDMVALLSDCHAGSSWTSDQVDGNSEYNFDIFCRNLWYYGEEIIRFAKVFRQSYGVTTLHIDCLGDIIQGVLRVEDQVKNDFEVLPLCVQTTKVLYQWLGHLANHFDQINFIGLPGNHGRMSPKPEAKRFSETNYDTLVYLMLRELVAKANGTFEGGTVKILVPKARIVTIDRRGHRIRLMHGDTIHGGNGISSIPLYGISRDSLRAFKKELRNQGGKLDLIEMGHFHCPSLLEGSVMMNGSMTPPDPWASDELGASSDPTQWVYLTGVKHTYSWSMPVSLKHAPVEHGLVFDSEVFDEV